MHPIHSVPCPPPANLARKGLGSLTLASLLSACIPGGGGDSGGTYLAVQGKTSNTVGTLTVCVDGAEFVDPTSAVATTFGRNLALVYGFQGTYSIFTGTGLNCEEKFGTAVVTVSVNDYNQRIVPLAQALTLAAGTPAPSPAPAPSPSPSPGPAPAPAPITPRICTSGSGSGTDGLELFGQSSFSIASAAASATSTVAFDPGEISYRNAALTSTSTTGSLRATLWALPFNYAGGAIQGGYVVARYPIRFTNGSTVLRNGESSNLNSQTLTAQTPPRGSYCMAVTLDMYSSTCTSSDGYCIMDWLQFPDQATFQ